MIDAVVHYRCAFLCIGGVDTGGCGVPQRQNRCNIDGMTPPPRSTAGFADVQRGPPPAGDGRSDVDRRPLNDAGDRRRSLSPPRQYVADGDAGGGMSTSRMAERGPSAARVSR